MTLIPFIADVEPGERKMWLKTFAEVAPDLAVKSVEEMSAAERRAAKVALIANPKPEDVAALPNLVWVQSLWAGVEKLIVDPALDHVRIARLIDPGLADSMSEAVLAWSLYLHRDMPAYRRQQAVKQWKPRAYYGAAARRIGILGLGALGRASARRLVAQGFDVAGWSRSGTSVDGVTVFKGEAGLTQLLERSDILVVLVPLTPETRGLLNAEMLTRLPQGASVINFARGPIIDDQALLAALDGDHLDHAVLDVFAVEPLPEQSPYWTHEKVTVLPHISGPSPFDSAARTALATVTAYLTDGTMPETVDRSVGY